MDDHGLAAVEEQHERLRRFVDEWRGHAWERIVKFDSGHNGSSFGADDGSDFPVSLHVDPQEPASVVDLIATDNSSFSKVLMVLAFDCLELWKLRKHAMEMIYPYLISFGLHASSVEVPCEGELQKGFGKALSFFCSLLPFLSRLRGLLSNLVQQLEALTREDTNSKPLFLSLSSVQFNTAIRALAQGFSILIIIDEIVAQNVAIGHSLSLFIRMLQSVRNEPPKFGMEAMQVDSLDEAVTRVDELLIEGIFQRCLQEDFCAHPDMGCIKTNLKFMDGCLSCLTNMVMNILPSLDSTKEHPNDRETLAGLLGVYVFCSWMRAEAPEKKICKVSLKVALRAPVLHVFANVRLVSFNFLMAHLPPWVSSLPIYKEARKDFNAINHVYLENLDEVLARDVPILQCTLSNWFVSFACTPSPSVQDMPVEHILDMQQKKLTQGIYLAHRLHLILKATLDLHMLLEVPIRKDQINHLRHAAELLKAVKRIYCKKSSETVQSVSHIIQHIEAQIQRHLSSLAAQLHADLAAQTKSSSMSLFSRTLTRRGRHMEIKLMDALTAVNLALRMLQGCPSPQRRITLDLALDVIFAIQSKLPEQTVGEIKRLRILMDIVTDIHLFIDIITDCSFLYWSREIMGTCFSMVYAQASEASNLQYLIDAFKDGIALLNTGSAERRTVQSYENEIESCLVNEVVTPLCRDIETDLRLHIHSAHLKGTVHVNPTKTGVRDLSSFLILNPLRLTSKWVHIKTRVETYLNGAFYDHAAVALHNWKTYNEMRNLAEQKYGLELDDIHLPGQTLEQGVDVLEIVRRIHIFVSSYAYNLNTQMFIEKPSSALNRKHLNTVSVKHVANSIRTHGTGIMSTTVNFVYQYLAQKFVMLSQFLFDDHIKSRLIKELRFYKENKPNHENGYPVSRAKKLIKDIQKLGIIEGGLSFLDQFRHLIVEMGNALGFVRIVRLGGLHYCSSASRFVQAINKKVTYEEAARQLNVSEAAVIAGRILDEALKSQSLSIEETDYFTILTSVFSRELQGSDNLHLQEFFLIVPALTINAAEMMLQAKESLHKRGRDAANAIFTDDGFVLGVVYILKVLGQDKEFDSLYWFGSIKRHLLGEKVHLEQLMDMDNNGSGMNGLQIWSQKLASISQDEAQSMQLVLKHTSNFLTEMEILEFTFSGARVFF